MGNQRTVRVGIRFIARTLAGCALLALTQLAWAAGFTGDLVLKVKKDGEHFELAQDFAFEDAQRRIWSVPKGTLIDGASIPRPLWTLVGSPMTGKYREASVIHDHFCDNKRRPWEQTHQVFYDAMVANGVDSATSRLFYFAVYRFGPRWDYSVSGYCKPGTKCATAKEEDRWDHKFDRFQPKFDQSEFDKLKKRIERSRGSDEQLRKSLDAAVATEATSSLAQ